MPCKKCKRDVPIENKDTGLCATCNKKAREPDEYDYAKQLFLEGAIARTAYCPICQKGVDKTFDIHHKKGRTGFADEWARTNNIPLLIDLRFFLAVDRLCHAWIEGHPYEARQLGYSLSRTGVEVPTEEFKETFDQILNRRR